MIRNDKNQVLNGLIGPYNEGVDVRLTCVADGGQSPVLNPLCRGGIVEGRADFDKKKDSGLGINLVSNRH